VCNGPFHCTRRSAAHRYRDKESRAEIIAAVKARYAATGGTERFLATMEIDHSVPCWLITFLLMQFFGTRDLGALTPVDKLWLYKVVKMLHNGFTNAMMVDTSQSMAYLAHVAPCDGVLHGRHQLRVSFDLDNRAQHSHRPGE
jgi:hypothetical protein